MLIREMTLEDITQVVEIEKSCFSIPWSEDSFRDSIQREDTLFLVCEEKSADADVYITGYAGMYISFEEANITNVAVAPAYRKKGYADALVSFAKKSVHEKEVERIFLEVRVSNQPAISLYEKHGFQSLGIRKNFYDRPREDAYIMCCDITDVKIKNN